MEKKIESFNELEVGNLVLIDNPLQKDSLASVTLIHKTQKYPIIDSNGNRQRSLGRVNGSIQFVNAVDEGCTGDEKILEYNLNGFGSYTFKEDDDPKAWNIRLIDNTHPKWDDKMSNGGKQFSNMMGFFAKMLGEDI
jgi:hypothetical protein